MFKGFWRPERLISGACRGISGQAALFLMPSAASRPDQARNQARCTLPR